MRRTPYTTIPGSGGLAPVPWGDEEVVFVRRQQTIAGPAVCAGIGVHSGAHVRIALTPAPVDTGIVFVRADVKAVDNVIRAHADFVSETRNCTTIRNASGAELATIEHLMSACAGLGVDNLYVEVDGPELPILDGSSAQFVAVLLNAGLKAQHAPQRVIRILEAIEVRMGAKSAALLPAAGFDGLDLDVTIRFADPAIGVQRRQIELSPKSFLSDIADARTFGFMSDVDAMRAAGLGRGASMENTLVVDAGRVVNPEGLRFEDEFVRHKMLDAIGDLAMAGAPICGRFVADQPGHALNARLVRALLDTPEAWRFEYESAPETVRAVQPALIAAVG
jgi:UDP-3-O-[3-hydroxymyristoyl] N-acetylglucosamine deacetylase